MKTRELSLRLDLQSGAEGISWRAFHRTGGTNASLSGYLNAPENPIPHTICSDFTEALAAEDLRRIQAVGRETAQKLLPEKVAQLLQSHKSGDVLFVVPLEWADVPFELLLIDSTFLGQQFRIGTIISIEREHNLGVDALSDRQILIIADPAQNLPSAFEEGAAINKLAVSKKKRSRLLTDVDKEKLSLSIGEASIVHFSGHSSISGDASASGWKLKSGELYTPADIAVSLANGPKAGLVFSNSCDAAKIERVAGIASEFLAAGVPQFVAPIIKVRDEAAKSVALRFYSSLFQGRCVSQSLLEVRKELVREGMVIAALSYRLFGDPCVVFSTTDKHEAVAANGVSSKLNRRKLITVGITVFIICIMLIVVLLGLAQDNVIYIPAK